MKFSLSEKMGWPILKHNLKHFRLWYQIVHIKAPLAIFHMKAFARLEHQHVHRVTHFKKRKWFFEYENYRFRVDIGLDDRSIEIKTYSSNSIFNFLFSDLILKVPKEFLKIISVIFV